MRGRGMARWVAAAQVMLLAGALVGPAAVAAATLGFTLGAPSVSTVQYSDLVTLQGTYTCVNDAASTCPTSSSLQTASFSLRPSGGSTFTTVATLLSSVVFTSNPAGCATTCTLPFQATWRAGRAGAVTVPPGVYDLGLSTTMSGGMLVSLSALAIAIEDSQTTYTGATSGLGGDPLSLGASVADLDRGLAPGTSIITPDVNLGGAAMVTFALYDAANTTLVAGPVSAQLASNGNTAGLPTLVAPMPGGTFSMRTTYVGNGFYATSSDLDTITVTPANTPPALLLPSSPVVREATSPGGADVTYTASATDAEDDPDPIPTCSPSSGSTFVLGDTTVTCSVTDGAGATSTGSFVVRVVDTIAPSGITLLGSSLVDGASYDFGSAPAAPGGCTATDAGSGLVSCVVSGYSNAVGDWTVTATATDAAGNAAAMTLGYSVLAWTLTGFAKPVEMDALNDLKAGGSTWLRFAVDAGATELTGAVAGIVLDQQPVACPTATRGGRGHAGPKGHVGPKGHDARRAGWWRHLVSHAPSTRRSGTAFSIRWQAPDQPGTCWLVTVRTADGSSLAALFRLR